jgi:hypothetical protein
MIAAMHTAPVYDHNDQYVSSMLQLLEQMNKVQHKKPAEVKENDDNVLPSINSVVDATYEPDMLIDSAPITISSVNNPPCSLQQISKMLGPPLNDHEGPYCAPLTDINDHPAATSAVSLPSISELEKTIEEQMEIQENANLGKRKRKLSITRASMSDFDEQPSKRTKYNSSPEQNMTDWQCSSLQSGKQLVCSGKIRRKNNKKLPQDNFQMKWTLK